MIRVAPQGTSREIMWRAAGQDEMVAAERASYLLEKYSFDADVEAALWGVVAIEASCRA